MPLRLPKREENENSHNTNCAEHHESGFKPAAVRSHISDHSYSLSVKKAVTDATKSSSTSARGRGREVVRALDASARREGGRHPSATAFFNF